MTDTVITTTPATAEVTPTATPATAESKIAADSESVLHDGEREARHGLSHLEDEFVAEFKKFVVYTEAEAKKLLAWIASKA